MKLVVVFIAAMVLVTIPVIPMRLYGVGLFNFKNISRLWSGTTDQRTGDSTIVGDQGQKTGTSVKADEELTSLDGAAEKLLVSINQNPAEPSLHNQLGLIYEGLGDNDRAIRQFQTAVDLSRNGLLSLSASQKTMRQQLANDKLASSMIQSAKLSTDLSAAHSALARIYDQMGMRDRVVAELDLLNRDRAFGSSVSQKATERTVTAPNGQSSTIHRLSPACLQLLARAQALGQAGRKGEAVQLYKQVLRLDPLAAIAHQQLGMTAAANGNYYLAKEELNRASELDPLNANTHINLGVTYKGMSQFDNARNEFQKAVQLDPRNYGALFQLGAMYASSGKNDLAAQTFQRVVELNPGSAAAHNNFGSSLSMTGRYREAIKEFEKALALSPNMASSHYGMGMALYNMKEYPAAIAELKQAVALNPSYADAKAKIQLAYRHTNSGAMGGAL